MPGGQILNFGPYQLDPKREQCWHESQPVRLTPKAFQVLSYLAERPGQLVTKEELFRVVWADTVVSDAALTACIQELRKALQDNARAPQYIETVHRRGFRFIGAVVSSQYPVGSNQPEETDQATGEVNPESSVQHPWTNGQRLESSGPSRASDEPRPIVTGQTLDSRVSDPRRQTLEATAPPAQRTWSGRNVALAGVVLLVGIIVMVQYLSRPSLSTPDLAFRTEATSQALPLPDKPSLIVLPFANLSGDPEQDYFSDGLTEVLTGHLSKISSLFVIARNSAFTYKGKAVKVQDVSREMGVRYVLEGSVQKADQRVRITTQLIDATTGYHVWSEQYDRPLTDLFALQDEIVQKIVTTLRLQLTMQERGHIVHKRTDNLEAYDAFLRGQAHYWRYTPADNSRARQLFERAVALDPQYAEAYASLSWTYFIEWAMHWSTDPQTPEQAVALAQQAVALDDSLPEAHTGLSLAYRSQQQYEQAIAAGERAIALDPNNDFSYANQAEVLNHAGRPADALRAIEQAMRLSPRYPFWYLWESGLAYRLMGRCAEAIVALKEVISRNPDFIPAHLNLAVCYVWQWRSQQTPSGQGLEPAVAAVQQALTLSDSYPWNHIVLGYIYLYQQQYERALAEMRQTMALAPNAAESYAALAATLSRVGRVEDALTAAAQAQRLKPDIADEHLAGVGMAYATAGRPEEAIGPLKQYLARFPDILDPHLTLAAVYSALGREAEARAEAAEVLRINPQFSLEVQRQREPMKDPVVLERHIAALRKAGLK